MRSGVRLAQQRRVVIPHLCVIRQARNWLIFGASAADFRQTDRRSKGEFCRRRFLAIDVLTVEIHVLFCAVFHAYVVFGLTCFSSVILLARL
jgi:hypothetical protein